MNKEEILIAIKEINCRYSIPAYEQNYTDKDYACKQYEKLVMHLAKQQEEKDKEIERLQAREKECINKYLAESKYRGEIEGKYVVDAYIINELEKYMTKLKKEFNLDLSICGIIMGIENKLKELKEGVNNE